MDPREPKRQRLSSDPLESAPAIALTCHNSEHHEHDAHRSLSFVVNQSRHLECHAPTFEYYNEVSDDEEMACNILASMEETHFLSAGALEANQADVVDDLESAMMELLEAPLINDEHYGSNVTLESDDLGVLNIFENDMLYYEALEMCAPKHEVVTAPSYGAVIAGRLPNHLRKSRKAFYQRKTHLGGGAAETQDYLPFIQYRLQQVYDVLIDPNKSSDPTEDKEMLDSLWCVTLDKKMEGELWIDDFARRGQSDTSFRIELAEGFVLPQDYSKLKRTISLLIPLIDPATARKFRIRSSPSLDFLSSEALTATWIINGVHGGRQITFVDNFTHTLQIYIEKANWFLATNKKDAYLKETMLVRDMLFLMANFVSHSDVRRTLKQCSVRKLIHAACRSLLITDTIASVDLILSFLEDSMISDVVVATLLFKTNQTTAANCLHDTLVMSIKILGRYCIGILQNPSKSEYNPPFSQQGCKA
jgi:hypothetical protein